MRITFAIILSLSVCLYSCSLKEPVAPTWDVQLTLPLLDTLRTLNELVEKDTNIIQISSGTNLISYNFKQPALSDSIGDRITFSPDAGRLALSLGPIQTADAEVNLSAKTPFSGTYPNLNPVTFQISAPEAAAPNFSYLNIESGDAELTIINRLPVPVAISGPISLTDGTGRVLTSFGGITGTIPPGDSIKNSNVLAGTVYNPIKISTNLTHDSITVSSPGSVNPITFTPNSEIIFRIRLKNIIITSATAQIPAQEVYRKDSTQILLDDSTFVQNARFKSGDFTITLDNHINIDVIVHIRMPQLRFNNIVYDSLLTIGKLSSISIHFDINRFQIYSPTPTGTLIYSLQIFELGSSGTDQVTISSTDSVTVVFNPGSTLIAKSMTAVLKPTQLNIDQNVSIDLGEFPSKFKIDSIKLPDANFTLNLKTPGFPTRISQFKIIARNLNQQPGVTDTVSFRDGRTVDLSPNIINQLVFNEGNSNIIDVLNNFISNARALPNNFTIIGTGLIHYNYSPSRIGMVGDTSKIVGEFNVDFPLNVGIRNGTVLDTIDIADKINISQSEIDKFNNGTLTIQIANYIPASFQLFFTMLNENRDSIWSFPKYGISMNAADVGLDRFVSGSQKSLIPLSLTREDIHSLVEAKFIKIEMKLNTPANITSVKFRSTDKIMMRLIGNLSYRITGN